MKEHELGPNGAILAALNLFCAQIDNTFADIEECENASEYVVIDTPG